MSNEKYVPSFSAYREMKMPARERRFWFEKELLWAYFHSLQFQLLAHPNKNENTYCHTKTIHINLRSR